MDKPFDAIVVYSNPFDCRSQQIEQEGGRAKAERKALIYTSSFARFRYSKRGFRSLTHMGVMRQGGNVTKFLR